MPDAAHILRRTIAERQLIGGKWQKPQKNGGFHQPKVIKKGAESLRSRRLRQAENSPLTAGNEMLTLLLNL